MATDSIVFTPMKDKRTNKCIAPEVGRLLTQYELGQLEQEEQDRFEEHLMDCDLCRRELEEMLPIITAIRGHKAEVAKALHSEGISFKSLKKQLLISRQTHRVKTRSIEYTRGRVLTWFKNIGKLRILVPAAVMVTTLFLFVTLLQYPKSPYLPYLSFQRLPYRLEKLRGEEATQGEQLFHQGMNDYLRGNYKGASNSLKRAVEKDPNNGIWWLYLGVCYYLNHQSKRAIGALTKADSLTQYSQKVRSRWYLAQAYLLEGDADRAIPLLEWIRDQKMGYSAQADSLLMIIHSVKTPDNQ